MGCPQDTGNRYAEPPASGVAVSSPHHPLQTDSGAGTPPAGALEHRGRRRGLRAVGSPPNLVRGGGILRLCATAVVVGGGWLWGGQAGEEEIGAWESVGVRCGISAHTSANRFIQTEVYSTWNVPLRVELGKAWGMQLQVDSSAGWLSGRGTDGFVGGFGPALEIGSHRLPLALVGGISPTLLLPDVFGNKDFGIPLQFTSHVGLEWRVLPRWDISYRFQHMSNGCLSSSNPGLNLHMFSLGYAF